MMAICGPIILVNVSNCAVDIRIQSVLEIKPIDTQTERQTVYVVKM